MTCQFSGKPRYNAAVSFGGEGYPAQEGTWTTPLDDFPSGRIRRMSSWTRAGPAQEIPSPT